MSQEPPPTPSQTSPPTPHPQPDTSGGEPAGEPAQPTGERPAGEPAGAPSPSKGRGRVAVLVPAHNEATRIQATVRALRDLPEVVEVLVVDDGSADDTRERALAAGAHCLALPRNRGKGGALNAGLLALTSRVHDGITPVPDALLLADADLGETAARLGSLLAPVLDGEAELAIADLPAQPGAGGFGLAMGLARRGIARFGGRHMTEPLSGQRAIAWDKVSALVPFAPGFGVEVAMTLRALDAGLRVVEVPVDLRHAATGRDWAGIRHRARQAGAIGRELLGAQARRTVRRARSLRTRQGS